MFVENVDADHYFLSPIANSSVQPEFSFKEWIIVDIFKLIKFSFDFTLIKSVKLIVSRV